MSTDSTPSPDSDQLRHGLIMEDLIRANAESNETMKRLVDNVRKETEARDRKVDLLNQNHRQMRLLVYLTCGAVLVLLIIATVNAFNIASSRRTQSQAAGIAIQVQRTNALLLDCVNATGTCGQINTDNQRRILDEVKQYELTVIYCARTNPQPIDEDGTKFIACVRRLYPGGPDLNGR